jgi:hypothetical protein
MTLTRGPQARADAGTVTRSGPGSDPGPGPTPGHAPGPGAGPAPRGWAAPGDRAPTDRHATGGGGGDGDGRRDGGGRGGREPAGTAAGRGLEGTAVVEALLVVAMAGLVAVAFRRVFATEPLAVLAVGGALGSVVLSTLVSRVAGWSASAAALASVLAAPAVLAVLAWRAVPSPAAWVEAARAVTAAPSRILSAPLPAPDRPELLVLVAALAWATGHASAELAARRRAPLAPLAPVAPALVVPLLLGAGGPRPGVAVVGGLAVAAGALVVVRASGPRPVVVGPGVRPSRRAQVAPALAMVVVAGLVPAVLGDALPFAAGDARVDPRGRVSATPPELRNPLVEVSSQRHAATTEEMFTASGPAGIELWRTAVLDDYDGATWRSAGVFEPVGSRLPDAAAPGEGPPARVDVTVGALGSRFIPSPGRPAGLDGVEARLDVATGALLADEPLGAGDRYRVDAAVDVPGEDDLDLAVRDRTGADAAAARRPVRGAGALADIAATQAATRTAGLEGTADIRQLRALQDFFSDQGRFRLATEPVGGLSLRHLTAFVGTAVNGGVSEASIEQFAAAYAVMARTLGYATRVVVGYRTSEPATDGTYHVDNRDAYAWAEVKLDELGWVAFVAAPVSTAEAPPRRPAPAAAVTTTTAPPPSTLPDAPDHPDDRRGRPSEAAGGSPWPIAGLALGLTAVLAGAGGAPTVRARRRGRRRRGTPAARVDGAWREVLDGLAAYGYPVTTAMAAPEVLAAAAGHVGDDVPASAVALARAANCARYGPAAPGPAAADEAWRRSGEVLAWARGHLSRRQRARAFLDVRAAVRGGTRTGGPGDRARPVAVPGGAR